MEAKAAIQVPGWSRSLSSSVSGSGGLLFLPPSVVIADTKGVIRSLNVAASRLFGYAKNELVGQKINVLMPPSIASQHDLLLERYMAGGSFNASSRVVYGVTKAGASIKIKVTTSCLKSESVTLLSALIEEEVDHTFAVTADEHGTIATVSGSCELTSGYVVKQLVSSNVSMLCPTTIGAAHQSYMREYVSGSYASKVIGHVRNRELRHAAGHVVPIALEVIQLCAAPLMFGATITEMQLSMEVIIIVNRAKKIVSISDPIFFGYEVDEMIGMSVSAISPIILLKKGKRVLACQHKDGSFFFACVDIERVVVGSQKCYRGIIHRAPLPAAARKRSVVPCVDDNLADASADALDWYKVTKKVLGVGYFGPVKVATHKLTGISVAIKTMKKARYAEAGLQFPPREVDLTMKLKHPNIFRFFHSIPTDEALFMISEVVTGGELFEYVAQKVRLSEDESRQFMRQIVSAVDYMHRSGVCHRDLKLENILLDATGKIKIIDFGLGNFFALAGDGMLQTFCGSPDYTPPEIWLGLQYKGPEIDIWSMGVIVYVMATGFLPFNTSTSIMDLWYQWPLLAPLTDAPPANDADLGKSGTSVSDALKDFVGKIFRTRAFRSSMQDLIDHPWLNDKEALRPIARYPLLDTSVRTVDPVVLSQVESLGLPRANVERDVLNREHNQLTTTYALLEFQEESRAARHARNFSAAAEGVSAPLTESPVIELESGRATSQDSHKKCVIA